MVGHEDCKNRSPVPLSFFPSFFASYADFALSTPLYKTHMLQRGRGFRAWHRALLINSRVNMKTMLYMVKNYVGKGPGAQSGWCPHSQERLLVPGLLSRFSPFALPGVWQPRHKSRRSPVSKARLRRQMGRQRRGRAIAFLLG